MHRAYIATKTPGSPPQVRGKPLKKAIEGGENRITPAGAGKTKSCSCGVFVGKDHPRRCGENYDSVAAWIAAAGSPPQVRGKRNRKRTDRRINRITPAGAGKTSPGCFGWGLTWDHPRRCGENSDRIMQLSVPVRITPAGAGKTYCNTVTISKIQDHPRRCGENASLELTADEVEGSPPQVRGKQTIDDRFQVAQGDHPRRCGENTNDN